MAAAPQANEPRINDRIRAREVRLVGADGDPLGIRPLPEALHLARENDLDLVEVAPQAVPPVCRIMDYGKWKFDAAQRAKESRRKTSQVTIKEMKYRVKIGVGDFDTKTRKVLEFLKEGHKVKITIMFRGREVDHPHLGRDILNRIAERATALAKVEAAPKLDGRNMIMVLAPDKRAQASHRSAGSRPGAASGDSRPSAPPPVGDGQRREPTPAPRADPAPTDAAPSPPPPPPPATGAAATAPSATAPSATAPSAPAAGPSPSPGPRAGPNGATTRPQTSPTPPQET